MLNLKMKRNTEKWLRWGAISTTILLIIVFVSFAALLEWSRYSTSVDKENRLLAAEASHPLDPSSHEKLGRLYMLRNHYGSDVSLRGLWARKASDEYALALKCTSDDLARCWLLPDVAVSAFEAGDYDRAEVIARAMVVRATPQPAHPWNDFNRGNSLHQGHLVLGRIALHRNEVVMAERELLLAGERPGSPTLKSFGPNMSLAKELLAAGRRDAVLKYFDECALFWHDRSSKLPAWRADIAAGRTPNFGANLYY